MTGHAPPPTRSNRSPRHRLDVGDRSRSGAFSALATTPVPVHDVAVSGDIAGWIVGPYETGPCRLSVRRVPDRAPTVLAAVCENEQASLEALALAGRSALYMSRWEDLEDVDSRGTRVVPTAGGRAREARAKPTETRMCEHVGRRVEVCLRKHVDAGRSGDGRLRRRRVPTGMPLRAEGNGLLLVRGEAPATQDPRRPSRSHSPVTGSPSFPPPTSGPTDGCPSQCSRRRTRSRSTTFVLARSFAPFRPRGARAIALAGGLLAMLAVDDTGWRIERYNLRSHRLDYSLSRPVERGAEHRGRQRLDRLQRRRRDPSCGRAVDGTLDFGRGGTRRWISRSTAAGSCGP